MTYDELITDMGNYDHGSYIQTVWSRIEYVTDVVVHGKNTDGVTVYTREETRTDESMDVTVLAGRNRWLAGLYRNQTIHAARSGVIMDVSRRKGLKDLDFSWRLYGERREQHATREQMDRFIEAWYGKDDDSE